MTTAPAHRRRARNSLLAAFLLVPLGAPAAAQYRDAGSDLDVVPNRKQQLEEAMEEAPWRLGGLRVAPWIGVRDINYVKEIDSAGNEREAQLTATGGAGLKVYAGLGPNVIFAAHALPEYSWWQKDRDRNAAVGRYGAGLFFWLNRLQGEVTARSVEQISFLSPDLLLQAPIRGDEAAASAQLRLFGSIALFASGSTTRTRVEDVPDLTVTDPALLLDRDAELVRGGLRYLLRGDRGHVGAGVFSERTEFLEADAARSNKGDGWYAESRLEGNNLDLVVLYEDRELEAEDSTFPGYSAANGNASLVFHPGWRLRFQVYGRRGLTYSARFLDTFREEERVGGAIISAIPRGTIRLFYESGDDNTFGSTSEHESVEAAGGLLEFSLGRLQVQIGARQTEFAPDLGPPRTIEEVIGALALSFGEQGEW